MPDGNDGEGSPAIVGGHHQVVLQVNQQVGRSHSSTVTIELYSYRGRRTIHRVMLRQSFYEQDNNGAKWGGEEVFLWAKSSCIFYLSLSHLMKGKSCTIYIHIYITLVIIYKYSFCSYRKSPVTYCTLPPSPIIISITVCRSSAKRYGLNFLVIYNAQYN